METILDMREDYGIHLNAFNQSLKDEINGIFDHFDNEVLKRESERVDVIEKSLDVFIKETVPDNIEQNSGEISRNLRRAYETFDIEKSKEMKRYQLLLS